MPAPAQETDRDRAISEALLNRNRFRFLGLTLDEIIKVFFQGNATVAIVVLILITIFLFREGAGFFGQNQRNIRVYRQAGLEYVDVIKRQVEEHTALTRGLNDLRLRQFMRLTEQGKPIEEVNAALGPFDEFATAFGDSVEDVRGLASDLTDVAAAIKQKDQIHADMVEKQHMLEAAGKYDEAAQVVAEPVDFAQETKVLTGTFDTYREANKAFAGKLQQAISQTPPVLVPEAGPRLERIKSETRKFIATFPRIEERMQAWRWDEPVPWYRSFTSFILGRQWLTASFWQDWYGIVPLFVGSLLVSIIALLIAVPLGVAGAIYVSEIAGAKERNFIKPYIEFISAIPSVVLGFFGIAVLGQTLRTISQVPWLSWVPGFPMSERLNSLTAGCLLALMAIPTIFSLAEDALTNLPRVFKEASYALGANRLQTIVRILVPASLSGIISAILLGFGRVIGETMVVLLCAGNRIAIPDFTEGIGAFVQPVHTMTGIIAQEMGEVVQGGIHYRALFMVGVVLFLLALGINYIAQKIVRRFRISIG